MANVEKLGLGHPAQLWCAFWALADEVGEHYLWRGRRDAKGRPIFSTRGPTLPAPQVAWVYTGRELDAGDALERTCTRKLCVRPEHHARRGRA